MDKTVADFLQGKSAHTIELFDHFISQYDLLAPVAVHATKSMIVISGPHRGAYITQLGKTFIDVVFPFKQAYTDNLCFTSIKRVPGTNDYNHHFRMCSKDDINEEVRHFMLLALRTSS